MLRNAIFSPSQKTCESNFKKPRYPCTHCRKGKGLYNLSPPYDISHYLLARLPSSSAGVKTIYVKLAYMENVFFPRASLLPMSDSSSTITREFAITRNHSMAVWQNGQHALTATPYTARQGFRQDDPRFILIMLLVLVPQSHFHHLHYD